MLDDGGTGSLWWATKTEWLGLLDVAGIGELPGGGETGGLRLVDVLRNVA